MTLLDLRVPLKLVHTGTALSKGWMWICNLQHLQTYSTAKKTRKSQRTEVKRTIGKELGGNHPFKSLFLQIILFKLQKEARDAGPAHSLCSVHLSSSAHPGCRRALLCILRQKCWNK